MTAEERTLVEYRLARARETLDEAELLFRADHLHPYVNRLYYACFYAMSALLLARGMAPSRHSHLRGLLHKEFVHPGLIPVEHGQFFDLLYNNRQKGDYSDLVAFDATQVQGWLGQTREFVDFVSALTLRQP